MQICYSLTKEKGFWYKLDNFGNLLDGGGWLTWRKPSPSEQKAEVMLALAHGVKGLTISVYDSYRGFDDVTEQWYTQVGLIGLPPNYEKDTLWYVFKDEIIPRLKDKLGSTLLDLDYTGEFIPLYCNNCPNHDSPTLGYLKIDCEASNYHWHAGFFEHKDYPDNNHFFLTNLRTVNSVTARLTVSNNTGYENVSFTDIEGGVGRVDTTIGLNSSVTYSELMPQGEGRLYRVAPVVLYGGRLLNDEYAGEGQVLIDDMVIENGAVLTINGVYSSKGNITVKSGGIINGSNGKIQFAAGKKLIIEGSGSITGTADSKLHIEF